MLTSVMVDLQEGGGSGDTGSGVGILSSDSCTEISAMH